MKESYSLVHALDQVRRSPKGITFIEKKKDVSISYNQLYEESMHVLYNLQCKGGKSGDLLLFQVEEQRSFLTLFWACLLGGLIPVPVTVGGTPEHRMKVMAIWEISKRPLWVAPTELYEPYHKQAVQDEGDLQFAELCERHLDLAELLIPVSRGILHEPQPEDIAFIQFSSGSTGDPKGVILTHRNLLRNIEAILRCSYAKSEDTALSWMPLTHDMGLIGFHLSPLVGGMNQYLMAPALFLFQPQLWMNKANQYRITQISSPNFGYTHFLKYFKPDQAVDWDLSSIRYIFNGAEPISIQVAEQFVDKLAPYGLKRNAMFPVYGMAEASLAVTFPPVEEELQAIYLDRSQMMIGTLVREVSAGSEGSIGFVNVGYPVDGCEVRICDDADLPLSDNAIGNIHIKGENVTSGYYENPLATSQALSADGWLNTGDLGFMRNGRLIITGRKKDILFVNGQNYYPHDLEALAQQSSPSIEAGKIAVCGIRDHVRGTDDIVAFVQHRGGLAEAFIPIAAELMNCVREKAGLELKAVVPTKQIPKTTSGKPQRYKLAERFMQGEFDGIVMELQALLQERFASRDKVAPADELEHRLMELWSSVLTNGRAEIIGVTDSFYEYGGDSLKAIVLASLVHKHMEVELPPSLLYELSTIRRLAVYIRQADKSSYVPIPQAEGIDAFPLSSSQRRMFIQEQIGNAGTAYNMPFAVQITGHIDAERLQAAWSTLAVRHQILRTTYGMKDGLFWQHVQPDSAALIAMQRVKAAVLDLDVEMERWVYPFDLQSGPLTRVVLIQLSEQNYLLVVDMHHIGSDGISANLLLSELFEHYAGLSLPDLGLQYHDYAAWEAERLHADSSAKLADYWRSRMAGKIPLLNFPTDNARPEKRTFDGKTAEFEFPSELAARMRMFTESRSITLYTLLMSIYSVLLNRYTQQDEMVVGTLVSGRNHADVQTMLGSFINYLPIRLHVDEDVSFMAHTESAQAVIQADLEQQDYPYDEIVALANAPTDPSRNPLFDTMVILHNQMDGAAIQGAAGLQVKAVRLPSRTAKLDLKLDVYPDGPDKLTGVWEYNIRLFRPETIERMSSHFLRLLEQVMVRPEKKLAELQLTTAAEHAALLEAFNPAPTPFPEEMLLHQWTERWAAEHPDRNAVMFEGQKLTYGELNGRANALARQLRACGVGPDEIVGVAADRSPEMMIALLAVLKAGGAYLPLVSDFPAERVRYMLDDSGARILLGQRHRLEQLEEIAFAGSKLDLDDPRLYEGDRTNLEPAAGPEHLAYVIYTSGSTGNPKGVLIEHRAIANRLDWMQQAYPLTEADVILQKTSFAFDVSVWELFWWSIAGASVRFLAPGAEKDPEAIARAIQESRVTTMHFVPSMLHLFLAYLAGDAARATSLSSLRYVFASGEALQAQQVERFNTLVNVPCGTRLINLYGPTEAAVDVSYYDCSAQEKLESVPIGRPIANIQLYIMSPGGELQPIGVPGELMIAGVGLARGYLNRPDLTNEKFIAYPFESGKRMYRTGDLAKWLPDGNIAYLGRMDQQVKIRGYRIELGEIEHLLLQHEDIEEAVVLAEQGADGDSQLCAYLVSNLDRKVAEIRDFLIQRLPVYMVPSLFRQLPAIPLSPNGKVDRKQLALLQGKGVLRAQYVPPTTQTELALAVIWQDILQLEQVGACDRFFEMGGHSLKAAQLASRIQRAFGVDASISEVFNRQTVRELAEWIDASESKPRDAIARVSREEKHPLSSAQARLFLLNKLEGVGTTYNLPFAILLDGAVDTKRVETALQTIVNRHETLRTSFVQVSGQPMQVVHSEAVFELEHRAAAAEELDTAISEFVRPFDLEQVPLLRAELIALTDGRQAIVCDMPHIAADGISIVWLMEEFMALYGGSKLLEPKVQAIDYAAWQAKRIHSQERQQQEGYWLNRLGGELPLLNLPLDSQRNSIPSYEGDRVTIPLAHKLSAEIREFARQSETTVYFVLLAVYKLLLSRYSGQEDILVGTPVAGREHADVEREIGMFVNTIVLRSAPKSDLSFWEFLKEVQRDGIDALSNQHYPFEELVQKLGTPRDRSRNPLFDTMFILQNIGAREQGDLGGIGATRYPINNKKSKFDLTVEVFETENDYRFELEYRTSLFRTETMERMGSHFLRLLEQVMVKPETKLAELQLTTAAERAALLEAFNPALTPFPEEMLLHQWTERWAAEHPDRNAVLFEGQKLTYGELNGRANVLARQLRACGVGPDEIVGVAADRSPEMMIALLAVLKAGGAYLPIVSDFPAERVRYMLEDSGARILLGQRHRLEQLEEIAFAGSKLELDDPRLYEGDRTNLEATAGPEHLAYVIYTSGSTGNPKGVLIEHRAIANRLNWMQQAYPLTEADVILQKTSFAFDVSVWELFWWSIAGASVRFLAPGSEKDPEAIARAIEESRVTTMHFVPSMLHLFLAYLAGDTARATSLSSLRYVFASGEALQAQQVERFNTLVNVPCGTRLINLYGPTEAAVDVSYYDCSAQEKLESVPIGRPIANIQLYIMSPGGELQPIGVPGELMIAGVGLARGYLNRPDLTKEKFLAHPFESGKRIYRTGDLAKWLPDGNIAYLGRMDQQVKIRGYRIELGEIEHQLLLLEEIKEAVVLTQEDTLGNQNLCAFLVLNKLVGVGELRGLLARELPEYMIPSRFIVLEELPLSQNGKIDRKQLLNGQLTALAEAEYVSPTDDLEIRLADIWGQLLDTERVGIHDNFFAAGGHSLLLLRLQALLEVEFPGRIKLTDLFAYPTIAQLAAHLRRLESDEELPDIRCVELPEAYFAQQHAAGLPTFKARLESEHGRLVADNVMQEAERISLLTSAAAYLFARLSKQTAFMLAYQDEAQQLHLIHVDLEGTSHLGTFVETVDRTIRSSRPVSSALLSARLRSVMLEDRGLLPLIYKRGSAAASDHALQSFAIRFSYYMEGEDCILLADYAADRMNRNSMKELFGQYVQTLQRFIRYYTDEKQAAVAAESGGSSE